MHLFSIILLLHLVYHVARIFHKALGEPVLWNTVFLWTQCLEFSLFPAHA